jgi:heterodisulfide reductase subunit A
MVSVGRHKNIKLLAYSEVDAVSGYVGNFDVHVRQKARYIDEEICTGCGQCAEVCPINVQNPFDMGLSQRKAVYRHSAQSIPNAYAIQKTGKAPCRDACPTDQRAMGYIALVRKKRYADAYCAIRREHPFPSVCGRVCNHQCEDACSRGLYDDPVNIMGIKRFVADWAYQHRDELPDMMDKSLIGTPFKDYPVATGKNVAIIGAGPAGLTAGLDLVRLGHKVKVFDELPLAGGMMRVGIPMHRLPWDMLDWEISKIIDEGVEIQLNTWVHDIPGLLEGGFDVVLIATGAHQAKKLRLRHSNHKDNWMSLDFLRKVALGEEFGLSGKIITILGGGNVAMDAGRTAIRLGEPEVHIVCLETRGEMPGFDWEIQVAEEEGILFHTGRTFKEIVVEKDQIVGVRCKKVKFHGFKGTTPDIEEIPNTEHIIKADIVIWAIGQGPDFSFLPQDGSVSILYPIGVQTDREMMTTVKGVFAAGDVHRGKTFFVVDAIGEGHHAARCIDRYLGGSNIYAESTNIPVAKLSKDEVAIKIERGDSAGWNRTPTRSIPLSHRRNNFQEVDLTLTEAEVLQEAERCLQCGVCSECLECAAACDRGAINHSMVDTTHTFKVGTIILATGFKDFDPSSAPEYGYGVYPNIITAMEFERMINPSGPTDGQVRLVNGQKPKRLAIIHCVGSRDEKYHEYCSRACCMYSIKIAQLAYDYLDAEVFDIYRDMRTFGKDYEEFFNRTKRKGVNFFHGRVTGVSPINRKLRVKWKDNYYNQPDHVDVDLVILATGFEPQLDARQIANRFGINRSPDGFFLEKHPKLGPVETATDGIYLAGACQSPKDIPDSVAQAGGAAAVAISLMDQGTIALDPSIAYVNSSLCSGCGQCVESCPYNAVSISCSLAEVNPYLCKGCGTCGAACSSKAMSLIHYNDQQLVNEIIGALTAEMIVPG